MYKILIADDQADERETISFLLKELAPEADVSTAANGKTALQLLDQKKFDLIITDVKMPFVNGLELAETIRQQDQQLPIIFVSGYGEFDFVKKALTLQAVDYLLKPLNPEEFNDLIRRTFKSIRSQQEHNRQNREVDQLVRQNTLHQVLNGVEWEQFSETELSATLPFARKIRYLMTIDIPTAEVSVESSELTKIFAPLKADWLLFERGQYVCFFTTDNLHEIKERKAKTLLNAAAHGITASMTISAKISGHCSIQAIFRRLQEDLRQRFYADGHNGSASLPDILTDAVQEIQWTNHFLQQLREEHFDIALNSIQKIITEFEQNTAASPSLVRFFFASLLQKAGETLDVDPKILRQTTQQLLNAQQLSAIESAFTVFLQQQAVTSASLVNTKNDYVKFTKRYIANHYYEAIGLEELAKQVALSPKYLSEIFIQEEGMGINKYLKDFRIAKAQELLLQTPAKVKQISEEVGFGNYPYFVKIFREAVGMTPDSFRKQKGGGL